MASSHETEKSSYDSQKVTVRRLWDTFATTREGTRPPSWNQLDEAMLTDRQLYDDFFNFITHEYLITSGEHVGQTLSVGTLGTYMSNFIRQACDKFRHKGNDNTKLFFTCLDPNCQTDEAVWFRSLKNGYLNAAFSRDVAAGKQIDNSDPPVYSEHIRLMVKAYSTVNTLAAAFRKLVIITLWCTVGRSGESAGLTWDGLEWDPHFKCVFVVVPQRKNSKIKIVPFAAGRSRHQDWFVAFGDYLVTNQYCEVYDPAGGNFVFPTLSKTKHPGTTINNIIKDIAGRGSSTYKGLIPDGKVGHRATAGTYMH